MKNGNSRTEPKEKKGKKKSVSKRIMTNVKIIILRFEAHHQSLCFVLHFVLTCFSRSLYLYRSVCCALYFVKKVESTISKLEYGYDDERRRRRRKRMKMDILIWNFLSAYVCVSVLEECARVWVGFTFNIITMATTNKQKNYEKEWKKTHKWIEITFNTREEKTKQICYLFLLLKLLFLFF